VGTGILDKQKILSYVILTLNGEKGKNPYSQPNYASEDFQRKRVVREGYMDPSLALRMTTLYS